MNILEIINDNFWAVAVTISALTLPISNLLISKFNPNGVWKQVISWVTSIVLTVIAYFGGLATFNDPVWLTIPLTGIVCGLSANGIYDRPTIKNFIKTYFSLLPKK